MNGVHGLSWIRPRCSVELDRRFLYVKKSVGMPSTLDHVKSLSVDLAEKNRSSNEVLINNMLYLLLFKIKSCCSSHVICIR